jgi:hypothetical protein
VDIIIENHSFTDAQSSTQIGLTAKKYDIFYFEEPTTPTPQLSKYVHDNTGLAVANRERIYIVVPPCSFHLYSHKSSIRTGMVARDMMVVVTIQREA